MYFCYVFLDPYTLFEYFFWHGRPYILYGNVVYKRLCATKRGVPLFEYNTLFFVSSKLLEQRKSVIGCIHYHACTTIVICCCGKFCSFRKEV